MISPQPTFLLDLGSPTFSKSYFPDLCQVSRPWLQKCIPTDPESGTNPWAINSRKPFGEDGHQEKFLLTYAETLTDWRRVTLSYDSSNALENSFEQQIGQKRFQRDKMDVLWSAIKESLTDIQLYTTVTNLKIETVDDRVHIHVIEDIDEIIHYPQSSVVKHLEYPQFKEDQVAMDSHLKDFVYKVVVGAEILVRYDIPGPNNVEDFLQELDALHRMQGSSHIVTLKGIVVDNEECVVKSYLTEYAEAGTLADIIYDYKGKIPWPQRERWAY